MNKAVAWMASAVGAVLLLVACGSVGPSYYLAGNSTSVLLIEWSAPQNGQAAGTITYDTPTGSAPGETLDVQTVPVKVTLNGSEVTFTLTGLAQFLGGGSLTGTLTGGGLQITMPPDAATGQIQSGTLASSTTSAYNAAVKALQHAIGAQNNAAQAEQQQQEQQHQISEDQQTVSNDISTLQSDAGGLSSDASTIASDAQQTSSDLASEKRDAAAGQGSDCYNVSSTVSYDASSTLEYDQQTTLSYDVDTLQTDIGTVQSDISQLSSDLATLSNAGGSTPDDPQGAISQARTDIKAAVNSANSSIQTVNADVNQGYAVANGLAYGQCTGDGPGSPPAPIPPISVPGVSASTGSASGTGPWLVIAAYYADVKSGNYRAAWKLINSGKTTGQTYSQFVTGYSCTGPEQVTELGQSGNVVTFDISATNTCTGHQQSYTATDTVRGGKIVAATITAR
jgi:hypothetical protein